MAARKKLTHHYRMQAQQTSGKLSLLIIISAYLCGHSFLIHDSNAAEAAVFLPQ